MALFIPFNYQPVSTTIKTGSYAVPAGNYARVTVTDKSLDFTIDSVIAIEQETFSSSTGTDATGVKFTNNTPNVLVGTIAQNNTSVTSVKSAASGITNNLYTGAAQTAASGSSINVILAPLDNLDVTTSAAGGTLYWNLSPLSSSPNSEFWVPPSTDLSGARYIVELFTKLT